MENASKALLIGTGVLIAILIIYVAMRMFSSASGVTESYHSKESSSEIAKFNSNFTKYVGAVVKNGNLSNQTYATIHDIITVSNFAWEYNIKRAKSLEINPTNANIESSKDYGLIHVNLYTTKPDGTKNIEIIKNLENKDNQCYKELISSCYYANNNSPNSRDIITYEIEISGYDAAGRITEINFHPSLSSTNGNINDGANGRLKNLDTTVINKKKEWKY